MLLAAGTQKYSSDAYAELAEVPNALRTVVEAVSAFDVTPVATGSDGYLLNPGTDELKEAVLTAAETGDVVLVYYTGHGVKPEGGPHYLITADSRPEKLILNGLRSAQIVELLTRWNSEGMTSDQPETLIILDCCFSGNVGLENLANALYRVGNQPKTWLIASASPTEWAQQGVFAQAFRQALNEPNTGRSQRYLSLDAIVEAVNQHTPSGGQVARYFSPPWGAVGVPPFFPNPDHQPGLSGLTLADQHWLVKLRGSTERDMSGFYLTGSTGRLHAAELVCEFVATPDSGAVLVVTGSPGTGKSTLLSLPVHLIDPIRRADLLTPHTPNPLVHQCASKLPAGTRVVAVHGHGLNTDQIAQVVANGLDRDVHTTTELLEDLQEAPIPTDATVTVLIDGVDEATSPRTLIGSLLRPLALDHGLRLAIGTRHHQADRPEGPDLATLLDASMTIDLDGQEFRDPEALSRYATELLLAAYEPHVRTPYQPGAGVSDPSKSLEIAATVGRSIADRATSPTGESFLTVWQMSLAVRNRSERIDTSKVDWTEQLPLALEHAFEEELLRDSDDRH